MTKYATKYDRTANRESILSNESFKLESTWTFVAATTGAIAHHPLFTVTGNVLVNVFGVCDTNLDSGGAATISIGTAGNVANIISVTTATVIDDGDLWITNVPTVQTQAISESSGIGLPWVVNDGQDITIDILTATITAGVIDFYCLWRPLSSDANVTVTTPA